ncbi:MAG: hypothetical protein HY369_03480 [Candidatus Aenigmarchaeota archaeon]|nr:hypothetical protein [Candidatus Aenigmarchaeota archaeon]
MTKLPSLAPSWKESAQRRLLSDALE